jgi:hypothetical protein
MLRPQRGAAERRPAGYPAVIEKILRHLKLWQDQTEPGCLSRAPPSTPPPDGGERIVELCFDDPFPDYDTEPVMAYANDPACHGVA